MNIKSLSLALCGALAAVIPATASAAPTSREVLDSYVTALFENCTQAVQTHSEASYAALKKVFAVAKPDHPNELHARGMQFTLSIRADDGDACIFLAQKSAPDNRVIAELLRQKLQAAHADRDKQPLIEGGESWLVPAPEDRNIAARVTLEVVWDDTFLVIHFLDQSAAAPPPVPPVAPPPPPPPPPR
jgi:hypothetical protein